MADNLGTLWFGADVDLKELKKNIAQGNKDILDALKMNYDPKSYQDMVNNLRSTLSKEQFEIKLTANTKGLFGQGVNNKQLNFGDLPQKILDQQKLVNGLISRVATLRAEYSRTGSDYIRDTLLPDALTKLAKERQVLNDLKATRAAYNQSLADSNKARRQASESARQLTSDGIRLNATLLGGIHVSTQLGSALSSVFAVDAARQFLHNIVEIGGQLEKQRISMGAIIGDTARANELFDQIKSMALKSPFGVVELDQYSKQLAAYGIEQSNLLDMTKRLADISAGAGQDIGRLALALGHVKSATYLTGITLRQFSMNNIPMLKMLADYYSEVEKRAVSTAEVQKRISKRQVSYDDVVEQIKRMTDEGGQFYNMQEKISESVAAKWKNLKDSLDIMYGDLAESKIGDVLKGTAELLMELTTRWKTLLPVLSVAAATFGLIRVSTLAVNTGMAVFNAHALKNTAATKEMTVAQRWMNIEMQKGALNFTLLGTKVTALTRLFASFRIGMAGVAATAKALGASLLAAVPQMAFLAGLSALVGLWQRHNEEMDKAKELGDQLFNRTQEGLKNLKQMMKETGMAFRDQYGNISNLFGQTPGQFEIPDFKKIDTAQAAKSIEVWTKFIKEYAATPNLMLESAYATDENGKAVHSLAEQYEILGEKAKIVAESLPLISQFGEYLSEAIEESVSGWLDDNLLTDIKDFQDAYKNVRKEAQDLYREQQKATTYALEAARGNAEFSKALEDGKIKADDYTSQLVLLVTQYNKFSEAWAKFRDGWNATTDKSMSSFSLFTGGGIAEAERELEREFNEVADRLKAKMASSGIDPAKLTEPERLALTRAFTDMATKAGLSVDQVRDRVWELINEKFPAIRLDISEVETSAQVSAIEDELNKLVDGEFHIDISTATNAFDVIQKIREGYKSAKDAIENAKPILMKMGVSVSGVAAMTEAQINDLANGSEFIKSMLQGVKKAQIQINDALKASSYGFSLSDPNKGGKTFRDSDAAANKAKREAEKRAKDRTKMAEAQLKIDEELAKQRLELEDAIADAEVAAIENNAERERAQRELEFKKQKRQLDKQVEEWKKKSFELAKKEHEANPKNKTVSFYDTPVGKAGWRGQSLTSEQEGIYAANLKKINAERKRQIEKDDRDLINAHASYTDRKIEIDRKYNEETEKLAVARREAEKRGDTQTIEAMNRAMAEAAKNRAKEQAKLSLDQLKEMPDYVRAFEDLENTSSETLDFLIKKFEEVKQTQAQTLTPTELKEYVDTIQKMTDEIAKRNPFKAIALANEDVAKATDEVTKAERRLAAVKRGMAPVVKIEKSANGQLNAVLLTQAEAEEQLRQAKDKQAKATKTREEVLEKLRAAMANFASTLKDLGSAIGGTAGEVIGFIADTVTFVNTASEAMKVASSKATGAMAVIEKGSAIITIIAAVINLLKELNELLPDASSKYQDYADKVSEINKATQAMEAYKIAVMEARMEEEHWFDNSSLGKLPELYNIGRQALDNYNEALMRSQAIYQNAQSGGWLTSFAHWTNPATWFKELFGWDSEWLDALAIFGSGGFGAEAMMGQLGIWLTEHANDDKYKYAEGMIAAIANLRIQTREKSSGFLGTGIGGHAEETEDLIKWVKENLKMDLFDEDFMLNEEAYKAIMDRYSDKLVGETQATLEELHDLKEKWDEYIDNLHEYVRDAYLPLQENYISALWDWYDEGKDVMDGFKDYAKSTFRDIITNMLATILNERYFKQFGETINGLYDQWAKGTLSEEDLMTGVASATSGLVTTLKDSTPVMQKIMTTVTSGFEKAGMSLQNVSNSTEDAESAFKDLRSSFLDTLMDMEGDAKDFRKKMEGIMVKDLIEKNVFSKAFTIGDEAYKNLDEYITKWNERYADAVAKNDTVLIDQLLDELVKVRELTIKEAEALRERLKDIAEDEDDTTFSGLSDSWVSTLMDMSKTAEDWAEDIGRTMAEKIIKEMVVPTMLQPLLDDLQSVFDTTLANATTTDADGNKTYDWDQVIQSPELFEEIERLTRAYPKAQEIIKKIMAAFGLDTSYYKHEGFSNLGGSIIDSLKSVDGSVEDWSKEQGKKMAEQMAQAYVDEVYGSKISELNEAWQKALDNGDDNAMKAIERDLETLYRKMADDPRLQEFIAKFKELADNPFKDMAKEFTQSLMDMEQTTEDFGLSIARNLTEQMIDKIIGDRYQAQIDALGNQWAEALKNGDTAAIERIKQEMMKLRDQMGEAVQPLLDAIKEIDEQTDTTFKDMTDSWVSALMDMDKTAEDWAQEVGKMMAQKIITEMIAPVYIQPLLNSMQEAFNNAMAVSGATFQSVMSAMVPFIGEIKEKFEEIRPLIEEIFGGFGIVTEAVEEVEEAVDEVEYALGDLKSEFSSALMDMESTAESFSKNIKNILAKTFVEKFILGDKFDAMMEQWQQQFEGILTGTMSDDQRKKSIQKLADSMTDYEQSLVGPVMSLLESLGLTAESNQEATMNMADKITYDQADQLLGINLAQELTLEQILAELQGKEILNVGSANRSLLRTSELMGNDEQGKLINATLTNIAQMTQQNHDNIMTQVAMANSHLQMIRDYNKRMCDQIELHMASMDTKLNNLSRL